MERLTELSEFFTINIASAVQKEAKKCAKEVLITAFLCPPAAVWNTASVALSLSLSQAYESVSITGRILDSDE